jgi:hypothetical protein
MPPEEQAGGRERLTLRRHGDAFERLPGGGGYYLAHGRIDDTMNLWGIKVKRKQQKRN